MMGALQATLFNDVLRTNKIRFEDNNQDNSYARRSMMLLVKGKPDDVALNVITPGEPQLRQ